ncbi:hypothetical protein RFI_00885 [Reticulomyxa filosa]|uniref:Uncharacterized protein n=1 Tax=Reticulomyxa filosa TaxID=46433 RepID=X6PCD0_RETFI|nr:hypothetical protein RFI_00885 [Reticulomyxa filosa]|eukprot:ETO36180.1 hypothetical protein RFI_00885 [Reticulomyxa filosa]
METRHKETAQTLKERIRQLRSLAELLHLKKEELRNEESQTRQQEQQEQQQLLLHRIKIEKLTNELLIIAEQLKHYKCEVHTERKKMEILLKTMAKESAKREELLSVFGSIKHRLQQLLAVEKNSTNTATTAE